MVDSGQWMYGIRKWIKNRRRQSRETRAYASLKRAGGIRAVDAIQSGFAKAERYRKWDNWSLERTCIVWLAELIVMHKIKRVVEFGAGYSTVVLADFIGRIAPDVRLDSFEHQESYAKHLRTCLPENDRVILHHVNLLQTDDEMFEKIFESYDPYDQFAKSSSFVPYERYAETRLRNAFYDIDFRTWEPDSVDLVILDGPNGNGRSLAFPFLAKTLQVPSWVLIDDYLDYPFLDYLQRMFVIDVKRHEEHEGKEYALAKIKEKRTTN